jgi:hypothetical protein
MPAPLIRGASGADGRTAAQPDSGWGLAGGPVWFLRIALTSVLVLCLVLVVREVATGKVRPLFTVDVGSTLANQVNRWFLLLTALLLGGFLALAMWQLWMRPAAEVRMEGIALEPVQLSIHDLAAIFMIASLAVAVLTNTWPFFVLRDLWPSGRFFYGVIFLLMSFGIIVPVLVAGVFAPDHVVIFIEWWEIALFAVFWGLETRRVARLRDNKVEKRHPDRGPLREPYRPRSASSPSRRSKRENRRARIRPTWAQRLGQLCTSAWIGNLLRESMPRSVCRSSRQPADLGGSSTGSPNWPPTGHTTGTIPLPSTQSRTLIMTPGQGPGHLGVRAAGSSPVSPTDRCTIIRA